MAYFPVNCGVIPSSPFSWRISRVSRAQVRFTLGTPLVVDPFRADRWDYVFVYMKQGVVTEQRRIMVVFKDDKLDRIEGDSEKLIGKVQERYGYARDQAQREVDRFLDRYPERHM